MKLIRKLALLGLAAVLLAGLVLLAACGQSIEPMEGRFEKGNEYIQAGMEAAVAGDSEKAAAEFTKAIAEFEAVVAEDPQDVSALTNLGVAYYNVGNLDAAIKQYQNALEIAPQDADIHSNLAAAYVQKAQISTTEIDSTQLEKAMVEYEQAIEINPKLAEAYFGLGVVYLSLGMNDEARPALESCQQYDEGKDATATELAKQYLEELKTP